MGNPLTEADQKTNKTLDDRALFFRGEYISYCVKNRREPRSIYGFTRDLNKTEGDFLDHYRSFSDLQSIIWEAYIDETLDAIVNDPVYSEYSSRERLLAFYYTLIERMKSDRDFVQFVLKRNLIRLELTPKFIRPFKKHFLKYTDDLVMQGIAGEEVAQRFFFANQYKHGLWLQLVSIVGFWSRDQSNEYEQTDALIEKSINLAFELMGRGAIDMVADLVKFLYQTRNK